MRVASGYIANMKPNLLNEQIKLAAKVQAGTELPAIITESRLSKNARKTFFGFRFAVNESMEIGREIANEDGSFSVIRAVIA